MRTIQINVGLSNNPLTAEQVVNYFATLQGYRLMAYYVTTKTYLGESEETFVGKLDDAKKELETHEKMLNQKENENIIPNIEISMFLAQQTIRLIEEGLINNEIDF